MLPNFPKCSREWIFQVFGVQPENIFQALIFLEEFFRFSTGQL